MQQLRLGPVCVITSPRPVTPCGLAPHSRSNSQGNSLHTQPGHSKYSLLVSSPGSCHQQRFVYTRAMQREEPGPGQESVWDYPRPPKLEPVPERITVELAGKVVADTTGAYRVLETSHPPTYYLPPKDVDMQQLKPSGGSSYCEWKGSASYYDAPGKPKIAWYYAKPTSSFTAIANYICFYPSKIDKATVGGETVTAQPGDFYGGWITSKLVGPFKGSPGTMGW